MKSWQAVASVLGSITTIYVSWAEIHTLRTKQQAFQKAKSLAGGKGVINLGAGPHRSFFAQRVAFSPEVRANIDIMPDGIPNFLRLDLEQTPYPWRDRQFSVCFASHVLEHLENWGGALIEMRRIADVVIVVLPHPFSLAGRLHPGHRQHFSFSEMQRLRSYPNVFVYY